VSAEDVSGDGVKVVRVGVNDVRVDDVRVGGVRVYGVIVNDVRVKCVRLGDCSCCESEW